MKKIIFVICVFCVSGCGSMNMNIKQEADNPAAPRNRVSKLSSKEVREMQVSGTVFILIDVRKVSDFNENHIEGAISVPFNEIPYKRFSKDIEIVTYCGNDACPTSKDAAEILSQAGNKKVSVLKGGLEEWESNGFPVVKKKSNSMKSLVPGITADELKKKIDMGQELLLIDVRSIDEYMAGHIEGAISETTAGIDNNADHEKELIVYSREGKRCMGKAQEYSVLGFKDVKTLLGGILVWEKRGYGLTSK